MEYRGEYQQYTVKPCSCFGPKYQTERQQSDNKQTKAFSRNWHMTKGDVRAACKQTQEPLFPTS